MTLSSTLFIIIVLIVLCFSFVLFFGAPFLPTLRPQITTALDLLALQPGQMLLELGCGDGRVMIAAAERGLRVIGYELNPLLAALAWTRTRRYGSHVKVVCGDYWRATWPAADGIFAFILTRYMAKLDQKIHADMHLPIKLASFAFPVPDKQPTAEKTGVFLYEYE